MESLGFAIVSLMSFGLGCFWSDNEVMPLIFRIAFLIGGTLTSIAVVVAH